MFKMKTIYFSLLLLLTINCFGQELQRISLPMAVENGSVEVQAIANEKRLGLNLKLKNNLDQVLDLQIPPGLHFKSKDEGAQDIFTIQEKAIKIHPKQTSVISIQGYCMQHYNYGPSRNDLYFFEGFASQPLKVLADSLVKYPSLNEAYAQQFVWALTDNISIGRNIYVDPSIESGIRNIVNYVCQQTNQPEASVIGLQPFAPQPELHTIMIKAMLAFHLPESKTASFGLFDENHQLVKAYYVNRHLPPGIHRYTIGVNKVVENEEEPVFYGKVMMSTGEVLAQIRLDKDTEFQNVESKTVKAPLRLNISEKVNFVKLNLYRKDGAFFQELGRYKVLEPGLYDIDIEFDHILEQGAVFFVKLEDANGRTYHYQEVK